jgi:hypothetical protein
MIFLQANVGNKRAYWTAPTLQFFSNVKEEIDAAVKYQKHSLNRFQGTFPQRYRGVFSPSRDPIGHFSNGNLNAILDMSDFCLPDIFVWLPEAEYPSLYPDGVPPCKFHGCSRCVMRHAWMQYPRRGHAITRNTAILGYIYYCAERKRDEIHPHYFNGIDKEVIDQSPDYIKMRWRMDGFDFSHQSGISLSLLRELHLLWCKVFQCLDFDRLISNRNESTI